MSELLKWKAQSNRKPLLLEDARQVGKTYLLRDFGKRHFKNDLQNISLRNIFLFEHLLDSPLKMCKIKVNLPREMCRININLPGKMYKTQLKQ